jgi:hypothetical protein
MVFANGDEMRPMTKTSLKCLDGFGPVGFIDNSRVNSAILAHLDRVDSVALKVTVGYYEISCFHLLRRGVGSEHFS